MPETLRVDFFVEDRAHEELLVALTKRVAKDEGVVIDCHIQTARGGHPRVMKAFRNYQTLRERGIGGPNNPDLLIVAIDGNCSKFDETRKSIREAASSSYSHRLITACPDPHIERWYLLDPQSFGTIVGGQPQVRSRKCDRSYYKQVLATAVAEAGYVLPLGGIELGRALAAKMDLYRAGKNDVSFRAFVADLRSGLRQASRKSNSA